MAKKGLGKRLGAIFGEDNIKESEEEIAKAKAAVTDNGDGKSGELMVKMALIEPNREQPRKDFNEEQLAELADSIKRYGILQPLLVQKKGTFYEIIAGERRWRADKIAGLKEIPVVLREYNKQESMEIALIENVQRSDLNPIEEALAYQRLVTEFKLTQEEIAARVSKNRATITNSMRLLKLDGQIQEMLIQNLISSGHARALLSLEDKGLQLKAAKIPEIRERVNQERAVFRNTITNRGRTFCAAAKEASLEICPYQYGYFVAIPCKNPVETARILMDQHIYVVPQAQGLRFSPCTVTTEKCRKAPAFIKAAMEQTQ